MGVDTPVPWTDEARRRVGNAPPFVRPDIWTLVERRARDRGLEIVDRALYDEALG